MKIVCPTCKQEYEVEESAIGQDVECVCGTKWRVQAAPLTEDDFKEIKEQVIIAVWQTVKETIKINLKSPASAKFEFENQKETIAYLGGSTFEVNSVVDSQNSFGALVRNYFTVICFYDGQKFIPTYWKLDEKIDTHQIQPKEIHCLICKGTIWHDASFESVQLVCPHCGKETTYIDLSAKSCLKKILMAIVVIPFLIAVAWLIIWYFFIL